MKTIRNPRPSTWSALSQRPVKDATSLNEQVAGVYSAIASDGDDALRRFIASFEGRLADRLLLPKKALDSGAVNATAKEKAAVDMAYEAIYAAQVSQVLPEPASVFTQPGVEVWAERRPIEKVGLYIPGGTAPLVSTVLMLGIPARIAGVRQVIIATPPLSDGTLSPILCYALQKVGAETVLLAGGMQAIAAMAIGTTSVPKVDKICGPGNQYVVAAKQYAQTIGVAIDMPAGPSEVMVIADETAEPSFVAADLLSQAEHGTDSQVVLATTSVDILRRTKQEIVRQLKVLPRADVANQALKNSLFVLFDDIDPAIEFANEYAPEHLILSVKQARDVSRRVVNAGSVFLGNYSPESAGDYASGTNHTLPTNGWSRTYSGLSVDSFSKWVYFQELSKDGLRSISGTIDVLATSEGLEAHNQAVKVRFAGDKRNV